MNQHPFTPAIAAQHRAELMAEAGQARDYRRAKQQRSRQLRLPPRPVLPSAARPVTVIRQLAWRRSLRARRLAEL
jgi:hypothetical protein